MEGVIKSIANRRNKRGEPLISIRVWDLPTRIFHWTLVLLVSFAWISSEYFEELGDPRLQWHRWNGFAILTIMIWRIQWGLWGPPSAQFKYFLKGPKAAFLYTADLICGKERHFLGHNPLGAYMIVSLLIVVIVISVLGLFSSEENDLAAGPLAYLINEKNQKLASKWHGLVFNRVLVLIVGIHITANSLYQIIKKEPLISAMLTGNKPEAIYEDEIILSLQQGLINRALLFLGFSLTCVMIVVFIVGR